MFPLHPRRAWVRVAMAAVLVGLLVNAIAQLVCCLPTASASAGAGPWSVLLILLSGLSSLVLAVLIALDWRRTDRLLRATEAARRRVDRLAHRDPLTDLPNRRALERELQRRCLGAEVGAKFALHLVDVDRLKAINDRFGHAIGDRTLRRVAERLRAAVREGDFVARFGGDEFAVLQSDASPERAERFAARLLEVLRGDEADATVAMLPSASIGTALAPGDADTPELLLQAADRALYAAKEGGRDRWVTASRLGAAGIDMPPWLLAQAAG